MQFAPPPTPPAIHAPAPRSRAIPPDATPTAPTLGTRACAVMGDSIALGLGGALRGCTTSAMKGIGSLAIAMRTTRVAGGYAVISAGSNDASNPRLAANLETIRWRTAAARVVWIAPRDTRASAAVAAVARRHGDQVVPLRTLRSTDGVHPDDYQALAAAVRKHLRG